MDPDKPVRVFRNWKHGCYNIMQEGRLRASATEVRLGDVEFRVRESGRQRMLRERQRNVHAFAIGRLLDWVHPDEQRRLGPLGGRAAFYDPYRFASFVDAGTCAPITTAALAQLDEGGLTYLEETLDRVA